MHSLLAAYARWKHRRELSLDWETQQREVQKPNNRTWDWEFDILLNHMLTRLEKAAKAIEAEKKGGAAKPAPAAPAAPKK